MIYAPIIHRAFNNVFPLRNLIHTQEYLCCAYSTRGMLRATKNRFCPTLLPVHLGRCSIHYVDFQVLIFNSLPILAKKMLWSRGLGILSCLAPVLIEVLFFKDKHAVIYDTIAKDFSGLILA